MTSMSRKSDPPSGSEPPIDAMDAEGVDAFLRLLEPVSADPTVRDRLLQSVRPEGRLSRHASTVAELLGVDETTAARLLDQACTPTSYQPGPFPGISLLHVEGGPKVASAITGFVRIAGGGSFPLHEHLGDETVLVLSGSMLEPESGRIHRAGDLVHARAGQAHTAVARPGPDLVYLAVVSEGLRIGDTEMRAGDPRL